LGIITVRFLDTLSREIRVLVVQQRIAAVLVSRDASFWVPP